jgi:protoporphyrinogen oxidase
MKFDILIIGGGISGLYTAYQIIERTSSPNLTIGILEASNKCGGRVSTYYDRKHHISYEEGAGRFNDKHILLMKLLKDLKLLKYRKPLDSTQNTILITDDFNKAKLAQYSAIRRQFSSVDDIIDKIRGEVKKRKLSREYLVSLNLLELAEQMIPEYPNISKYIVDNSAYFSELEYLNSACALDIFSSEFNQHVQYYALQGGLSQIIKALVDKLNKAGVKIMFNARCSNIEWNSANSGNSRGWWNLEIDGRAGILECSQLVLACPKQSLVLFDILKPIKPLLNAITSQPFYRVYAKYPKNSDGTYWFSRKTITNLNIKFIIPIDGEHGIIMISYIDGKFAKYWQNLRITDGESAFMAELSRELAQIFPDVEIPAPTWIRHYYWAYGSGYWRVGYDPNQLIPQIIQPFADGRPLYICGDNYSNHQAWMEGALETGEMVVSEILKINLLGLVGGGAKKTYTLAEVAKHNKKSDAWIVIHKKVYDITKWIPIHPGGMIILKGVGKDATELFESIGHDSYARKMLAKYKIGNLLQN